MSDSAKPSIPDDEVPTKPTGEREAATARGATTAPVPPPTSEPPVVWPRDMSAPTTEAPTWGHDPKAGGRE
jgi:hypothetical protein